MDPLSFMDRFFVEENMHPTTRNGKLSTSYHLQNRGCSLKGWLLTREMMNYIDFIHANLSNQAGCSKEWLLKKGVV